MVTRLILIALIGIALAGCDPAYRASVAKKSAEGADAALSVSEWGMCRASSVGAIMRRYWQDQETADAWLHLCWTGKQPVKIEVPK